MQKPPYPETEPAVESVQDFPPVLDLKHYGSAYEDLRSFSNDELIRHFIDWGEKEGRAGSPLCFREYFVPIISKDISTLEIGPFCGPLLRGDHVRYFDIADREALIEKAQQLQYNFTEAPMIDYVSPIGDLGIIQDSFHQLFSAHCVEHQPDLIYHLAQVSRILQNGGSYFLIIPDKRYCFDHYLCESTICDVLGAHIEQKKLHYAKSVLEQSLLTTHNDPVRHWQGDHGIPEIRKQGLDCAKIAFDNISRNSDIYINTHAWQFTPESFEELSTQIYKLGLSELQVDRVYNTPFGRFEFCAILTKR
jgi:hypothetical protein